MASAIAAQAVHARVPQRAELKAPCHGDGDAEVDEEAVHARLYRV
jgi:hypothetical protein